MKHARDFAEDLPVDPGRSLTDQGRVAAWTDDEIEAIAASETDHPALDDLFWKAVDQASSGRTVSPDGPEIGDELSERSLASVGVDDLRRLSEIAIGKLDEIALRLQGRPSARNRPRLRLLALAQGAAAHYVDHRHGVKDFDVWAFFESGGEQDFPWRPVWHADFGRSRFGAHPIDQAKGFLGRRVDIMGRSIPFDLSVDLLASLRAWLEGGSESARYLAVRPLVVIYPEALRGVVISPDTQGAA